MGTPTNLIRISPSNVVIFEWCFVGLAFFFVALRLCVRLRQTRRLNASDCMIVLTLFCFITTASCDTVMVRSRFYDESLSLTDRDGPNSAFVRLPSSLLEHLLKMLYASTVPYYLSLWLVKITLVLLYYTLVPHTMPKYRYVLHGISVIIGMSLVIVLAMNIFWCMPVSSNWDVTNPNACVAYFELSPYLGTIVLHVLTEIMIFTYPLVLLRVIRFKKRSFRRAAVMFAVGFAGMLISISRIIYIMVVVTTPVISVWQAWASVEQCFGIVVCCLPALRFAVNDARQRVSTSECLSFIRCSLIGLVKKEKDPNQDSTIVEKGLAVENLKAIEAGELGLEAEAIPSTHRDDVERNTQRSSYRQTVAFDDAVSEISVDTLIGIDEEQGFDRDSTRRNRGSVVSLGYVAERLPVTVQPAHLEHPL